MLPKSGEHFKRFRYSKTDRILKRPQFLALSDRKTRPDIKLNLGSFLVLGRFNGLAGSRLGITVTKKVGPAVVRNRLKRQVRELFRLNHDQWPAGIDYLFIARQSAGQLSRTEAAADLCRVGAKLGKVRPAAAQPDDEDNGSRKDFQASFSPGGAGDIPGDDTAQESAGKLIVRLSLNVAAFIQSVLADLALGLIFIYQRLISPLLPPACRFRPTCSSYAAQAIRIHGFWRGSYLAAKRLLKCHPLHPGGDDPVPPKR